MNELKYRSWAKENGKSNKTICDDISRIRKIERELNLLLDDEYHKDKCVYVLSLFDKTGNNDEMKKYNTTLPVGKYFISAYKYSIKKYIAYLNDINKEKA